VLFCASPLQQIPETATTFDATDLGQAIKRRVVLWPEEPEPPAEAPLQVAPAIPPAGWFAKVLGA
jgi:hypothetical protein